MTDQLIEAEFNRLVDSLVEEAKTNPKSALRTMFHFELMFFANLHRAAPALDGNRIHDYVAAFYENVRFGEAFHFTETVLLDIEKMKTPFEVALYFRKLLATLGERCLSSSHRLETLRDGLDRDYHPAPSKEAGK